MDIQNMQDEVTEWAESKGWEPNLERTFGEECALLHSEVSEALEAYRTWKFEDGTIVVTSTLDEDLSRLPIKPEGVASELADVLIRLLHYSKVRNLRIDIEWGRDRDVPSTFGEQCAQLHEFISAAYVLYRNDKIEGTERVLSRLYRFLLRLCEIYGFDLEAEYRRKMDYNKTRAWRHGGRVM